MKKLEAGDILVVRSDIAMWSIADDTNIVWSEAQQNLAWQQVTLQQVIDNPNGSPIYIIKEDDSGAWWAPWFFVEWKKWRTKDLLAEKTTKKKVIKKEVVVDDDDLFDDAPTIQIDPIQLTIETMREWKVKFKPKVTDEDTLWELFFSKLEDTLRIKFDN